MERCFCGKSISEWCGSFKYLNRQYSLIVILSPGLPSGAAAKEGKKNISG